MKEHKVRRFFPAGPEAVFAALTEPGALAQWWGPEGFESHDIKVDARVGGVFSLAMRGPDGVDNPMAGHFTEVSAPHGFSWDTEALSLQGKALLRSTARLDLTPKDGGCLLSLDVVAEPLVPEAESMVEGMPVGWNQSLHRLEDYLEGSLDRQIVTMAFLPVSPEKAYDAWLDPAGIGQWWGPEGFSLTQKTMDARVGGEWRFVMHGPDGKDYPNLDRYRELERPSRIVLEHVAPAFTMKVHFDAFRDGTILSMRQTFPSPKAAEDARGLYHAAEGAAQTLARLGAFLEAGEVK